MATSTQYNQVVCQSTSNIRVNASNTSPESDHGHMFGNNMDTSEANDFPTNGTVVDETPHSAGNDLNEKDVAAPVPKYTSYLEYITDLKKYSSCYEDLHEIFTCTGWGLGTFRVLLTDTMVSGEVMTKLFAFEQLHDLESTTDSSERLTDINEKIISDLQKQTNSALQTRIIVIEIWDRHESGVRTIIDRIGVQYDIDPSFFLHFFTAGYDYRTFNYSAIRCPLPRNPRFLRLHGSMVAMILPCTHGCGSRYNTVLILSVTPQYDPYIHPLLFNGRPSIYKSVGISLNMAAEQNYRKEAILWHSKGYQEWILSLKRNAIVANDLDPLSYIVPWLEYKIYDLSIATRDLEYAMFKSESATGDMSELVTYRTSDLENTVYIFEDLFQIVSEFTKLSSRPQSTPGLDAVISLYDRTVNDARTVLHISTGRMQKHLTELSIEESRRSVQEAISVKRLTQLAFVFIPLNFASSVFGMNLNELTGVGPHIWVFVTTSICLVATVLLFVPMTKSLGKNWKRREKTVYFWYGQDKMTFIYLCLKQRRLALLRIGILLSLLTNGRYGDFDGMLALGHNVREQKARGHDAV